MSTQGRQEGWVRYLETVYELARGDPLATVDPVTVGRKEMLAEEQAREIRDDLLDRRLIESPSDTAIRITVAGIHTVEEHWRGTGWGLRAHAGERRRDRYLAVVYRTANGVPGEPVDQRTLAKLLDWPREVELAARHYLQEAGFLEKGPADAVQLTPLGASRAEASGL